MLNLNNLRLLLSQVVASGNINIATLLTPEGQLVSFASNPPRSKDEVRVIVGLSSEIWQETKEQDVGMADSEVQELFPSLLAVLLIVHLIPAWPHPCPPCRAGAKNIRN